MNRRSSGCVAGWLGILALACNRAEPVERAQPLSATPAAGGAATNQNPSAAPAGRSVALLAGGCFWGVEELLRQLPGVTNIVVGYTGGTLENPAYEDVKTGSTQHAESVRVEFDPSVLSYERLLLYFFSIHDPTTKDRQGNDIGTQYRSAIFVLDEEQRRVALSVIEKVAAAGDWKAPISTVVSSATAFYPAEDYHQDYLQKHPGGYTCHYPRSVSFY